jgi:hypothetical protein
LQNLLVAFTARGLARYGIVLYEVFGKHVIGRL